MSSKFIPPKSRYSYGFKCIAILVILFFNTSLIALPPKSAHAQPMMELPLPGTMLSTTPAFFPTMVKGLTIHPENPLEFDFIVDTGDSNYQGKKLREESDKLIKYFLAALTVPEEELWVNLSPYEQDRIISDGFGDTEMGRDLLGQDYILKQLTASLVYPEDQLGSTFWNRVYTKAQELYGTTDIPINTFNKIWIVPQKAVVFEKDSSAYVVDSKLKVMLEEDYVALMANEDNKRFGTDQVDGDDLEVISGVSSEVVREILIPEIEKEVNKGKNFAGLRQIYNALVLATWYKQNLKESMLGQLYVDQNKTRGVDVDDKQVKEKIYNQYLEAFKTGVYDYIKQEYDPASQQVLAKKYFSGGFSMKNPDSGMLSTIVTKASFDLADWGSFTPNVQMDYQQELDGRGNQYTVSWKGYDVGPQANLQDFTDQAEQWLANNVDTTAPEATSISNNVAERLGVDLAAENDDKFLNLDAALKVKESQIDELLKKFIFKDDVKALLKEYVLNGGDAEVVYDKLKITLQRNELFIDSVDLFKEFIVALKLSAIHSVHPNQIRFAVQAYVKGDSDKEIKEIVAESLMEDLTSNKELVQKAEQIISDVIAIKRGQKIDLNRKKQESVLGRLENDKKSLGINSRTIGNIKRYLSGEMSINNLGKSLRFTNNDVFSDKKKLVQLYVRIITLQVNAIHDLNPKKFKQIFNVMVTNLLITEDNRQALVNELLLVLNQERLSPVDKKIIEQLKLKKVQQITEDLKEFAEIDLALRVSYDAQALSGDSRDPLQIFLDQALYKTKYGEKTFFDKNAHGRFGMEREDIINILSQIFLRIHFEKQDTSRVNFQDVDDQELQNLIEGLSSEMMAFVDDIITFSEKAYVRDESTDEARIFLWKIGEWAFDAKYRKDLSIDRKFLYEQSMPEASRSGVLSEDRSLPILDLAGGPRTAYFMQSIQSDEQLIIVDNSYFIEGFLNRAKQEFDIGDNVIVRRVDLRKTDQLFLESAYRHVRLGNIEVYVSNVSLLFFKKLMSLIAPGGSVSFDFPYLKFERIIENQRLSKNFYELAFQKSAVNNKSIADDYEFLLNFHHPLMAIHSIRGDSNWRIETGMTQDPSTRRKKLKYVTLTRNYVESIAPAPTLTEQGDFFKDSGMLSSEMLLDKVVQSRIALDAAMNVSGEESSSERHERFFELLGIAKEFSDNGEPEAEGSAYIKNPDFQEAVLYSIVRTILDEVSAVMPMRYDTRSERIQIGRNKNDVPRMDEIDWLGFAQLFGEDDKNRPRVLNMSRFEDWTNSITLYTLISSVRDMILESVMHHFTEGNNLLALKSHISGIASGDIESQATKETYNSRENVGVQWEKEVRVLGLALSYHKINRLNHVIDSPIINKALKDFQVKPDQSLNVMDDPVGGIDLNPALLDLQIKRDDKGIPLPLNQQPIYDMQIEGILPIIINVAPITTNLPLQLGLIVTDDTYDAASQPTSPNLSRTNELPPNEENKKLQLGYLKP